jgi:4'-phosphopantetheinyl transferase EntD
MTGRSWARVALRRLGAPVVAVPTRWRSELPWHAGVVGAVAYRPGYRALAAARAEAIIGLGIDAEP